MKSSIIRCLAIFFVLISILILEAVDIGSDTAVTRFNTSQTVNNGDRIAGFAELAAGFSLSSSSVSATWDCFFPVIGTVALNSGTLILNQDLIFFNVAALSTLGTLRGQSHVLELSPSMNCIQTTSAPRNALFSDIQMFMNDNITLKDSSITFSGTSFINGRGNTLTLASTFTLFLATGSSLLLKDVTITGLSGTNMNAVDNTATFSFQNTSLVLSGDFTFIRSRFEVLRNLTIVGDGKAFIYRSPSQSIIRGGRFSATDVCSPIFSGVMTLEQGVTLSYDSSITNTLLRLESSVSTIVMNSATLVATTSLALTTGKLIVDGSSSFQSRDGIIFGDNTVAGNLCVEIQPAAHLNVLTGKLIYRNV